jgi:hypothetical protein
MLEGWNLGMYNSIVSEIAAKLIPQKKSGQVLLKKIPFLFKFRLFRYVRVDQMFLHFRSFNI